jgi:predicted enzyme related to lactoylglutathione lyase
MSERPDYQPGVPCWVAAVELDPDRAVGFYTELFGWEAEDLMPPDSPASYFMCRLDGRPVAAVVSVDGAPPPPGALWGTYISVDSADETAARVSEAGGSVIGVPFDSPAGGRMAVLADPEGAVFGVWQPGTHPGAEVVNEPSAWAMSALQTRAPERAKKFYSDVFGWAADAMDGSGGGVILWRVPGYVGGKPEQPVPRDVVAVMMPLGADVPAELPAQWGVDFWVHDADETATKAVELGGSVLVAPHDTAGFRNAVLADPDGAAFSVSKLTMGA